MPTIRDLEKLHPTNSPPGNSAPESAAPRRSPPKIRLRFRTAVSNASASVSASATAQAGAPSKVLGMTITLTRGSVGPYAEQSCVALHGIRGKREARPFRGTAPQRVNMKPPERLVQGADRGAHAEA